MKFEYNGHLSEPERITQVAQEIISKYPRVTISSAIEAAFLEGRISEEKTFNNELNRLYNIMLTNSNNKQVVEEIYHDYLKLIGNNQTEDDYQYVNLIIPITEYLQGYTEFPIIADYP